MDFFTFPAELVQAMNEMMDGSGTPESQKRNVEVSSTLTALGLFTTVLSLVYPPVANIFFNAHGRVAQTSRIVSRTGTVIGLFLAILGVFLISGLDILAITLVAVLYSLLALIAIVAVIMALRWLSKEFLPLGRS